jgi:two-component system LytT family response regulator
MNKPKLINTFIVDDNIEAIKVLQNMLENKFSVKVVGSARDAETAAKAIIKCEPDIIFLDVELPTMSGLEFCTLIRNDIKPETKIVFYTGHNKYMLDAIRRQAFDYLQKPPTEQDLSLIMARYYENKLSDISRTSNSCETREHLPIILVVNAINEHLTLQLSDIAFFRFNQERKIWDIICIDNNTYTLRHRTTATVILNYSPDFVQIHKRYIVNINKIKKIQESICILEEPMSDNRELKISKNYRQSFMAAFYSM